MPRQKKQHLKQRPDGRFACRYKNLWFYGASDDEALQARDDYKRLEKSGAFISQKAPTIAEYAEKWLPREKVKVSHQTYAEAATLLEKLLNAIGDKRFDEVKPSDIKQIYSDYFTKLSNSYTKAAAQLYRALFDAALDDGYCKSNPARAKSAKPDMRETETKTRSITEQERTWIETLCTDHRAHAAVMTMLYAGIRPQEAKAMNIDRDVDFENKIIHVRESVHLDGSNNYIRTKKLKTKYSEREIPLFEPLRTALAGKHGMLVESANNKPVTVQAWRSVWESYVFSIETAINGCQARWYGKKVEHKGVELQPFIHFDVLPYDLRHSFCTMCRDNNVEINTCIHWMGHKDAKMILKIYDEFSQDRSKNEAEKLEKALIRSQNGSQKKKYRIKRSKINTHRL